MGGGKSKHFFFLCISEYILLSFVLVYFALSIPLICFFFFLREDLAGRVSPLLEILALESSMITVMRKQYYTQRGWGFFYEV